MTAVPVVATDQPHDVAAHHQRALRPLSRLAYRLSQIIFYGAFTPQPFVNR